MPVKSYKVRLDLRPSFGQATDSKRFKDSTAELEFVQKALNDTRDAFNVGVDYLTGWLLRMHRGAGMMRERRDGIWGEWTEVTTHAALITAKANKIKDPDNFALLENTQLLKGFTERGRTEAEAVALAECCRRIAKDLCPPSEDRDGAQMPRDDLDLLTLATSTAKGIRERGNTQTGEPKKRSGRKPTWALKQALHEKCAGASSWEELRQQLAAMPQFKGAQRDGASLLARLEKRHREKNWQEIKAALAEYASTWDKDQKTAEDKTRESTESGSIAAYRDLLQADCLPIPGFERPDKKLKIQDGLSQWNYAMWAMAGQRVRSHLGWTRRRTNERTVWERSTLLFERGGWVRTKKPDGRPLKREELTPEDIRFIQPDGSEIDQFEPRHAYARRKWVKVLREDYEGREMLMHLESVAFGAREQPRILRRTMKGWGRIREKWMTMIKKAENARKSAPTSSHLMEEVNELRTRKSREFGDQRLFEWLAAAEHHWLWNGSLDGNNNECGREDRDCLSVFVDYNEHLADKPDSITFTRSDAIKHPVWPFFAEPASAIGYTMRCETNADSKSRLILILAQLLSKNDDGTYVAVGDVKIPLRGYDDFEKSFKFPDNANELSPKQAITFRDDLWGNRPRQGSLGGLKLVWDRSELQAHQRKQVAAKRLPRIFAIFSCETGEALEPEWMTKHVGSSFKLDKPQDGMTRAFYLKKPIRTESAGAKRPPGERQWPKEAIQHGFAVRGTDLGFRTSSAGVVWRLVTHPPQNAVAWRVGECDKKPVYAVWERGSTVSLPGDGEVLPSLEQVLRDRLRILRAWLSLNNALLRATRLLTLEGIVRKTFDGNKMRKRADGTVKPVGTKWKMETKCLATDAIKDNCRKAGEQLLRWAGAEAMNELLKVIGHNGDIWSWLSEYSPALANVKNHVPTTAVPTEDDAKTNGLDRDALKATRENEDNTFAEAIHSYRKTLAAALCDGYNAEKRIRARTGLWAEFDAVLLRELSYGDRKVKNGKRESLNEGLFRLLRKPPVTKHHDRKDEANNLPHGQTHRGGLSMPRLNFLDDVKNFVRRWSCRPRWPGDVRRIAEDAKFDRPDTEHLDHLREHRAKLIAHTDVAQTLGFDQDLRRGVWLAQAGKPDERVWHRPERGHFYRMTANGELQQCDTPALLKTEDPSFPHACFQPAQVLVYENLTRYKMQSDRPKNENAGLARWSHRRILGFAQHIGNLFGVPVATVDARFSSRFCSHCGAPGCRASPFDPAWLAQQWMIRRLEWNDRKDRELRETAEKVRTNREFYERNPSKREWVLMDGGTHFVCANSGCKVHKAPINADENAAANIGLRFLRGIDGIRVWLSANGLPSRPVGHIGVLAFVINGSSQEREPYWVATTEEAKKQRRKSKGINANDVNDEEETADMESGGGFYIFRDPSGGHRPADRWYEGKVFWYWVAQAAAHGIHAANASRFSSGE